MSGRSTKNNFSKKSNSYHMYTAWVIAVFSFVLYANTIANDYNLDDELVTKGHPLTSKGISGLINIFSSPYFSDASGNVYEYRPVVLATFAIEHQFFGDSPQVGHFINALLYGLLIFVLFKLLRSLFENYNILLPLGATLLFAAHPIHTEVVASIKNRDEILAFLFGVLALQMAVNFIKSNKYPYLLLTIFLFLLGLLSKKSMLPFAIIIPMALIMFKQPKFTHLIYIIVPLSIISSSTSYFFNINTRIIFSIFIITVPLCLYILNEIKSVYHLKNHLKDFIKNNFRFSFEQKESIEYSIIKTDTKKFFISLMVISLFLCFVGLINTSKYILAIVFVINFLVYFLAISKDKEYILISITLSAILLLAYFSIAAGIILVFAYFLKNFNYKRGIHLLCVAIFIIPLLLFFDFEYIYLFLITGLIFLSFQIKKAHLVSAITSLLLTFIYITVKVSIKTIDIETIFISTAFIIVGFSFNSNIFASYKLKTTITFIISLFILSEVFFAINYIPNIEFIKSDNLSKSTEIMPASGRSLDFAEMPLKQTSPIAVRAGTAFMTMAFYLKLLILPHPLGFYYGFDMIPIVSISNHWAIISFILHITLFFMALFWFNKNKIISFAILYYLISISIFSNIVAPVAGLIGERLTFTASLGFCIALAYLLLKISKIKADANPNLIKTNKIYLWGIIVIISLYSFKTFSRNTEWKNHITLFGSDMVYLNRSAQANNMYAGALIEYLQKEKNAQKRNQMFDMAIEHFKKAINIYPDFYNASYNLGKAYYFTKKYDDAISTFEQTLKIDSSEYMIYMYLGIVNDEKSNYEKSKYYYLKTIEKKPDFVDAYTNLSALYLKYNETQKAIETNLEILKIIPNAYDPTLNIGKIYFAAKDLPSALVYFEKAFALNKNDKNLINALYEINKSMGNVEKADYYLNLLRKPA